MEFVVACVLVAGAVTASLVPWSRVRRLGGRLSRQVAERRSERRSAGSAGQDWTAQGGQDRDDDLVVESYLYNRPFLRRRMLALAEELDRLDRDPGVFAKAFHTMAARSAYEALLADAQRLDEQPRQPRGPAIDVQYVTASGGSREEIEL